MLLLSLASTLISLIGSPPVKAAYKKVLSIEEAEDDLDKLVETITAIKAALPDAEQRQESSDSVKNWVERVKDVLYDAEDLFDEVATDEMRNQQIINEDKLLKKVRASFSKFNPFYRNSIAKKVKAIRKRLSAISNDMEELKFVISQPEELKSIAWQGKDPGSFIDSQKVFGRDEEKKSILKFLLQDQSNDNVLVTAIVGIGGMGKSTLAQLVYNDEEVKKNFHNRWFAYISNTSDDTEVMGKIFQSVCDQQTYGGFNLTQLQERIRDSIRGKKFLLVLDDVWDEDCARWQRRISLLSGGARGIKIIVTTRSLSVARVVGALETHNLEGLLEEESWDLFKSLAFSPGQEKDLMRVKLGREIVKKCANVPLALKSVGSLLFTKDTKEWKSFKDEELSNLELNGDSVIHTLKLSYYHLPFYLKPCFAYCSIFPKGHAFDKDELIYLWIAQGYIIIKPNNENIEKQTIEETGYSYFMKLHRRSFFQTQFDWREISKKKFTMHDLLHDLAQSIAGEEIITLTKPRNQVNKRTRHVCVGPEVDISWARKGSVVQIILNTSWQLRSLVFFSQKDRNAEFKRILNIDQLMFTQKRCLRALSLSHFADNVWSSIGELKHLRYLNLSNSRFVSLPDSLTNLLNLLTLDIKRCFFLEALPDSFRKLINLRHLNIEGCIRLKHMPPGMRELTCLQELSDFQVGKAIEGVQRSGLDALDGFELRGELRISFEDGIDNWDGDECWKLPVSLEQLTIMNYPGRRIPHWSNDVLSLLSNLQRLTLVQCNNVKQLPPLRGLPNLMFLKLEGLNALEYIEEEEEDVDECTPVAAGYINNHASFFPLLEKFDMLGLGKLKGWSRRKVATTTTSSAASASPDMFLSFPRLRQLKISYCPELTSFPLCPCVSSLNIYNVPGGVIQHLLSSCSTTTGASPSSSLEYMDGCEGLVSFPDVALTSLKSCHINGCHSLENLHMLASPLLKELTIENCNALTSVEVEALPSLIYLKIDNCNRLKSLHIARLNALRILIVRGCPSELELWRLQQEERVVDWDSLPNLRLIEVDRLPPKELPNCLLQRHALGQLKFSNGEASPLENCLLLAEATGDEDMWRFLSILPSYMYYT